MMKSFLKLSALLLIGSGCCCNAADTAAKPANAPGSGAMLEEVVVVMPCGCPHSKKCKGKCTMKADSATSPEMACTAEKCHKKAVHPAEPKSAAKAANLQIGHDLVTSFCKDDAKAFRSKLPPEMQKEFQESHFKAARKDLTDRLGKPVKGEFMAEIAHPVMNISVWKVTFIKEEAGKKPVERQALFQVVTGDDHGQERLLSFGFL